jgi:Rab-3A-interacting protein
VKAASAERSLIEADMKIDGLETEVAALKTLVLTSTPARPNRQLLQARNGSRPSSASR